MVVLADRFDERLSEIREHFGQLALNGIARRLPYQQRISVAKWAGAAPSISPSEW